MKVFFKDRAEIYRGVLKDVWRDPTLENSEGKAAEFLNFSVPGGVAEIKTFIKAEGAGRFGAGSG